MLALYLVLLTACPPAADEALQLELDTLEAEHERLLTAFGELETETAAALSFYRAQQADEPPALTHPWVTIEDDGSLVLELDALPSLDRQRDDLGFALPVRLTSHDLQGIRLFGLRPGTPLARLGLTSGDIVLSVNGTVADPDWSPYDLLSHAISDDTATVQVDRCRSVLDVEFHVR